MIPRVIFTLKFICSKLKKKCLQNCFVSDALNFKRAYLKQKNIVEKSEYNKHNIVS